MKGVMKKLRKNCDYIIMIVLGVILVFSFVVSENKGIPNKKPNTATVLNEITVDKYLQLLKKDELNIIYIASPICPHCRRATPILENIAKEYSITINYLNSSKFSQNDSDNFNNSNEQFKDGKWGVPTLIIVKNNEIVETLAGVPQENNKVYEKYINLFSKHKLINKK